MGGGGGCTNGIIDGSVATEEAARMRRGGGCTNGIIYGSVATLNTRKCGAAP